MQQYRNAENFGRTTFENALTSGPHCLSYSILAICQVVANKPVTVSYKDTFGYERTGGIILEECLLAVIHDLIKERYLGTRVT